MVLSKEDYKIISELLVKANTDECSVVSKMFQRQIELNINKAELKVQRYFTDEEDNE